MLGGWGVSPLYLPLDSVPLALALRAGAAPVPLGTRLLSHVPEYVHLSPTGKALDVLTSNGSQLMDW